MKKAKNLILILFVASLAVEYFANTYDLFAYPEDVTLVLSILVLTSVIINIFGFIWENLSIKPSVPKSGEQEDHIAPIDEDAKKHSTVSIWFDIYAAILSFLEILFFLKKWISLEVLQLKLFHDLISL